VTEAPRLARLELVCFGPPTARLGGGPPPADVVWRKHLGLLIYLALSPDRTRTREHLTGLFWPEKPEQRARHSLNEAVRRLRARLGAERLQTKGDTYTLNEDGLEVDVSRFAALAPTRPADAVTVLRGDFLEGFGLEDAPGFEEWAARERTKWRARGAAALVAAGEAALASGRLPEAEEAALRALDLEPHGEAGARLRLRAVALRGDTAGALAAYHGFSDRLRAEVGEVPSRSLQELAQRIRDRTWHRVSNPAVEPAAPLVGRKEVQDVAFRVMEEAMAGAPRTLVLLGAPGFGKTRLVSECLSRAALDGAVTVSVTPLESDHDAPWSSLRALGRAGLSSAPGSAATDPEALAILGAVFSDPGERSAHPPGDHGEVASALTRLLSAVADDQPLVVAVDDAHFADGATLDALGAAMGGMRRGPVLLVLACLAEADRAPPALMRLRSEVGRRLPGDTIRLDALEAADVGTLVDVLAPWCREEDTRERLARRVHFESGGSPFLVVTLLQALTRASTMREDVLAWPRRGETIDSPLPISVPDLVRMAVVVRVSELAADDVALLRAASVAGEAFDLDVLCKTSGLTDQALNESLVRLERSGLVTCDGRRYAFAAPLIAEVVRQACLTPGQRRALRKETAEALAGRGDMEARVLRLELLSQVAPDDAVLAEALAIADDAITAAAVRSAKRALAAAERTAASGTVTHVPAARLASLRQRLESLRQS
jgi:DNA-binding SARP family transcriptional activator